MTRKLTILSLILLASCHKDNGPAGNTQQITGNYKFLYLIDQNRNIYVEVNSGITDSIVSYTNYKTLNNSGTINFTKDSIFSKNIVYSVDTTIISYKYRNGMLLDTSYTSLLTGSLPSSTATKFNITGKDSIAFDGAYQPTNNSTPINGGHFSFKGDMLILTAIFQQMDSPINGPAYSTKNQVYGVRNIFLLRQ